MKHPVPNVETSSSELFDAVAVYLAVDQGLVELEDLGLRVTDNGFTLVDDNAKVVHCATRWRDLPAFADWLVSRLTTGQCKAKGNQS